MKNKVLQYTLLGCSLMFLFSACRKDSFNGTEAKGTGKTFVWITEAQTNNQFFDVFTNIKPVTMFTVRRDAANSADLQKAVTVSLKALDQAYITAKAGAAYTLLPNSIYTLVAQPGVSIAGNNDLTLSFASGDFAKNIIFNIDGSKVDLSKQYAVAYVITNFGGFSKQHTAGGVSQDTIVATVAIKNKWDGIYTSVGTMADKIAPTLTDFNDYLAGEGSATYGVDPPQQYEFRTISATTCDIWDNYFYTNTHIFNINSAGARSSYGSFCPQFAFDPATNKVASVVNFYGQPAPANGRFAELDPSGDNAYDPGTKTIKVKWFMFQPGVTSAAHPAPLGAHEPRTSFDYTFTYVGSR